MYNRMVLMVVCCRNRMPFDVNGYICMPMNVSFYAKTLIESDRSVKAWFPYSCDCCSSVGTVADSITTFVFPYSCNCCNLGIDFPLVLRTSRSNDRRFMLKLRWRVVWENLDLGESHNLVSNTLS